MGNYQTQQLAARGVNCTGLDTTSQQTSTNGLWYFANGYWLLVPFLLCWISFLYLFVEHGLHLDHAESWQIRYQALYVRIVGFFPLISTMALLSAFYPWTSLWFNVVFGIIEGYLISCFLALVIGLGWLKTRGHYPDAIIEIQNRPNQPWWAILRRWPKFKTGEQALSAMKWGALQLMIVKPVTLLVPAAIETASNGAGEPPVLKGVLRTIATISVICAIASSLRAYATTRDVQGAPLSGHDGAWKLLTIKLLFTFILLDQIIVSPLIDAGTISIDAWICPSAVIQCNDFYRQLCEIRLETVVFLSQVAILSLPTFLFFRHMELTDKPHFTPSLMLTFIKYVMSYGDLSNFFSGDLPENKIFLESHHSDEAEALLGRAPSSSSRAFGLFGKIPSAVQDQLVNL